MQGKHFYPGRAPAQGRRDRKTIELARQLHVCRGPSNRADVADVRGLPGLLGALAADRDLPLTWPLDPRHLVEQG